MLPRHLLLCYELEQFDCSPKNRFFLFFLNKIDNRINEIQSPRPRPSLLCPTIPISPASAAAKSTPYSLAAFW